MDGNRPPKASQVRQAANRQALKDRVWAVVERDRAEQERLIAEAMEMFEPLPTPELGEP